MKQMKRLLAVLLCAALLGTLSVSALAAEGSNDGDKSYLVLGADLSGDQLSTVLDLLEVDAPESYLEDYNVYYTTNEEEYEFFGDYLDASVIGTRALSCIKLTPLDQGEGIHITTRNISYCTVSMYQNALITAGVSDVELVVAGPTSISGTAALVSAAKAYEIMTGQPLNQDSVDAANNELVVTGELGEALGDAETAAELIAALKNEVFADGTDVTDEEIEDALDRICIEMEITLDDELRQQIIDLIKKIANTDFDVSALKEQASELFNKVSSILDEMGVTEEDVGNFFTRLWEAILDFFRNIFG